MRPYYFDSDMPQTRRAAAIPAFERTMRSGSWPPPRREGWRLWHEAMALVREWRCRARQRRELASLDARLLRDIGVSPSEAAGEMNKPFWRA